MAERKTEDHDLIKRSTIKAKPEDNSGLVTNIKTAFKLLTTNSQQKETKKQVSTVGLTPNARCAVCKGNHRLWGC